MPRSGSDTPRVRTGAVTSSGRRLIGLLALLAAVALPGCASFSEGFAKVEQQAAARNLVGAIESLEGMKLSGSDQSLNHLNKGILLRLQGEYARSNAELDSAKRILDEAGAISFSEQALSVAANDTMKSYEGDGNEQLLIYGTKALNYLQMGDLDAAAVEARQFDIKSRLVAEQNPSAKHASGAFVRYLNGMVYEAVGERDSARIEYTKAIEAYKLESAITGSGPPKALLADLARIEGRARARKPAAAPPPAPAAPVAEVRAKGKKGSKSRTEPGPEVAAAPPVSATPAESEPAAPPEPAMPSGTGEVVFLLHNGLGPSLAENIIQVPNPAPGSGAAILRLALPKFVARPVPVSQVELTAGGVSATSEMVANINALAKQSLDDRLPAIQARALARLVAKNVAAAAAKKQIDERGGGGLGGALLKLGADIAAVASERADTRTWAMLPGNFQMARLQLPAGKHMLRADYYGQQGNQLVSRQYPVEVRAGKKAFVSDYYVVAPPPAGK